MTAPAPKNLPITCSSAAERRYFDHPQRQEMLQLLNCTQRFELHRYETAGWALRFVRHPMFGSPTPVLVNRRSGCAALLEPDGSLNEDHQLRLRQSALAS